MQPRDVIKALAVTAAFWSAAAQAQTYPSRPIVMVVPYAAGGTFDVMGRISCGPDERAAEPTVDRRECDRRWRHHRGDPCHQRGARWLYAAAGQHRNPRL